MRVCLYKAFRENLGKIAFYPNDVMLRLSHPPYAVNVAQPRPFNPEIRSMEDREFQVGR
jgi:hypothetical protein